MALSAGRLSDWNGLVGPLLALLLASLFRLVQNRYNRGLSSFPGPVLASLSDIWRFLLVLRGDAHHEQQKLHEVYGPIVRLGPGTLSFAEPAAIHDIYASKLAFRKSEFYPVQQGIKNGRPVATIFSTIDPTYHAQLRRGASKSYALTTLLQYEAFVDRATHELLKQIESRWADQTGPQEVCDWATWLQYYAFDVISELTYGNAMGFLRTGSDVGGLIDTISRGLKYAGPIGQMPLLDRLLRKNPIKLLLGSFGLLDDTQLHVQFGKRKFEERLGQTEHLDQKAGDAKSPIDFLDRFLRAHRIEGRITETQAFSLAQSNINAGSDTTAISLRAIFYYLLKNPRAYDALMTEINEAERNNAFVDVETGLVTWTEAQNLCYLDATIMEALRIHPAVGLCLERVVPPEGATICGKSIPGNIIVGCNPWVINFDKDTFGADAQVFRPERWLEANPDQLALMKKYLFTFGAGSHACIGKNISMLEMYKVVPAVLRRFSLRLAEPEREWKCVNSWFVMQHDLRVSFERRSRRHSSVISV